MANLSPMIAAMNQALRDRLARWRSGEPRTRRLLQFVSLLYSILFFVQPWTVNTPQVWVRFTLFYAVFLVLYFAIPATRGLRQAVLLAGMFLLAFCWFSFDPDAVGAFVYPVVLMARVLDRAGRFLPALAVAIGLILLETRLLHLPLAAAEAGIFFCVVIGLSNLAYFQEEAANRELVAANAEIARLTQGAERERIARDLHDLLGHTLTLIAVKLDLARRLLPTDAARAAGEMADAEHTARRALADVRDAVAGYRSQGLASEITRMRHSLQAGGIQLAAELPDVVLPPLQLDTLCLVLREAATNIVRHAGATACRVTLYQTDLATCLAVADNGSGGAIREGNGLGFMRERVAALGGSLRIAATPHGTTLDVALPLSGVAR